VSASVDQNPFPPLRLSARCLGAQHAALMSVYLVLIVIVFRSADGDGILTQRSLSLILR
jgi:hypothetical protein